MRLSLIGMAGAGKSYWSERLAEQDFRRFCCDDLIAGKLAPDLRRPDGGVMDLGEWMGFPYMTDYSNRESRYLTCETEVIRGILKYLQGPEPDPEEDLVVDTSGSVIYTGDDLLEELGRRTTIVYLHTPPEVQESLLESYLSRPHPMLWRGMFIKEDGETTDEALVRSYRRLFSSRERLYERHAQVTIDYYGRRHKDFGVKDFLRRVMSG
jgi:shikimate kinase